MVDHLENARRQVEVRLGLEALKAHADKQLEHLEAMRDHPGVTPEQWDAAEGEYILSLDQLQDALALEGLRSTGRDGDDWYEPVPAEQRASVELRDAQIDQFAWRNLTPEQVQAIQDGRKALVDLMDGPNVTQEVVDRWESAWARCEQLGISSYQFGANRIYEQPDRDWTRAGHAWER